MSPAEVRTALHEGRLDELLGRQPKPGSADGGAKLSRADLAAMPPEDVVAAHRAGKLDHLQTGGKRTRLRRGGLRRGR